LFGVIAMLVDHFIMSMMAISIFRARVFLSSRGNGQGIKSQQPQTRNIIRKLLGTFGEPTSIKLETTDSAGMASMLRIALDSWPMRLGTVARARSRKSCIK